jgi:hypothetical protein
MLISDFTDPSVREAQKASLILASQPPAPEKAANPEDEDGEEDNEDEEEKKPDGAADSTKEKAGAHPPKKAPQPTKKIKPKHSETEALAKRFSAVENLLNALLVQVEHRNKAILTDQDMEDADEANTEDDYDQEHQEQDNDPEQEEDDSAIETYPEKDQQNEQRTPQNTKILSQRPGTRQGDRATRVTNYSAALSTAVAERPDPATAAGTDDREVNAEYRRWRKRAIDDVKVGKTQRGFTTTLIPEYLHTFLSRELQGCTTTEQVWSVFARAQGTTKEENITA